MIIFLGSLTLAIRPPPLPPPPHPPPPSIYSHVTPLNFLAMVY